MEQSQHTATDHEFRRFLESLDGRLPAEFVAGLRARMAGGHVAEVAHAVVFAAVAGPTALSDAEIDLLIATLAGADEDATMTQAIPRSGLTDAGRRPS
ncbi:hypothetical protein [Actinoplanes sp. NPDC048796]|uniref:hypothetical protein n=1 Tax=unclassified Actinoplanes TaxID=2626549 RepID=UPI00340111E6